MLPLFPNYKKVQTLTICFNFLL